MMVRIRRFRHQYGFERPEAPHSLRNSHLQSYTSSSIFRSSQELMKPYFMKYWKAVGLHTKPSLAIGGKAPSFLF
ncbi:hypothetical protein HanPI659440_Chr06g0241741 [Helianthus annuus]|nr:hypothetical protein HanPI659440_Chr06g0241741 [Helianthus annuus]